MISKTTVMAFKSLSALFSGFMSFGYIAIMNISGIPDFEIAIILTIAIVVQALFYFMIIVTNVKRNLIIFSVLELAIGLILLFFRNFYAFLGIAIIMGISNSIFSAIVVIQKGFRRRDFSLLMGFTRGAATVGLLLFYISGFTGLNDVIIFLLAILFLNLIISITLKTKEPETSLKDSYNFLKRNRVLLLVMSFSSSMRRTVIATLFPLILLTIFSLTSPERISLYYAIFSIPAVFFLYTGKKISGKQYLILCIMEFLIFVVVAFFYGVSIIMILFLVLVIDVIGAIRSPTSETVVFSKLEYNSKFVSMFALIGMFFTAIIMLSIAFLIRYSQFLIIFMLAGIFTLIGNMVIYKLIPDVHYDLLR